MTELRTNRTDAPAACLLALGVQFGEPVVLVKLDFPEVVVPCVYAERDNLIEPKPDLSRHMQLEVAFFWYPVWDNLAKAEQPWKWHSKHFVL